MGIPQRQEAEEGEPPEQRALLAHGMQGQGGTQNPTNALRRPPEQRAPPLHGVQGGGGEIWLEPQPDGEGGDPPSRLARPLCAD